MGRPSKRLNTEELFFQGLVKRQAEHAKGESKKLGNLRGGESGILLSEGVVGHSKCARLVYARQHGLDLGLFSEDDPNKELMFEAGRRNEDGWVDALKRAYRYEIKQEEEIPVSWKTKNGTLVTGRPDVVLMDYKGAPKHGIELKGIFSTWTARDVLNDRPRVTALMQAAHYSMALGGIPFDVHYTSRSNINASKIGGWPENLPEGKYTSPDYEGNRFLFTVGPFNRTWKLDWDGDLLYVNNKETVIRQSGIKGYYEMLSELGKGQETFPEKTVHFDRHTGQAHPKSWKPDKYCPLKGSGFCCADKGSCANVKEWHESIVDHVSNKSSTNKEK